jgi:hypothetical protein
VFLQVCVGHIDEFDVVSFGQLAAENMGAVNHLHNPYFGVVHIHNQRRGNHQTCEQQWPQNAHYYETLVLDARQILALYYGQYLSHFY